MATASASASTPDATLASGAPALAAWVLTAALRRFYLDDVPETVSFITPPPPPSSRRP